MLSLDEDLKDDDSDSYCSPYDRIPSPYTKTPEQIYIEKGTLHPNTTTEEQLFKKYMSTYWNELEVGMGLMSNLPILLVKDANIDSGVFENKLSEFFVGTILSDYNSRELEYNPSLKTWLSTF